MAVNVVIGLYYYLRWAALLSARPDRRRPRRRRRTGIPVGPTASASGLAIAVGVASPSLPQSVLGLPRTVARACSAEATPDRAAGNATGSAIR